MKKFKLFLITLCCAIFSLCLFACGEAELSLDKKSVTVTVGDTVTISAKSSEGGAVTWSTEDTDVLFINGSTITAIGAGQARLTATADGVSKTVTVTVRALKEYVVNIDGDTQVVTAGETVSRPADPVKQSDGKYTYGFAGWFVKGTDTEYDFSKPVDKALVIESRFVKTPVKYAVTIGDADAVSYDYGSLIAQPVAPVKQSDAQYHYTFDGWYVVGSDTEWNFRNDKVQGDVALEARYVSTVRTYTVSVNGAVKFVKYGEKIAMPASQPQKASTADKEYEFDAWVISGTDTEWDFENDVVTGDLTIEARFAETDREFTVVFMVEGEVYGTYGPFANGEAVARPENPTKQSQDGNDFTFTDWYVAGTAIKWSDEIDGAKIDGNQIVVVANFVSAGRKVTVTFNDGSKTYEKVVNYGAVFGLPVPTKADDAENSYIFKHWATEDGNAYDYSALTEDITLTAVWTAQPKTYTVTTYLDTGKLLNKTTVYGGKKAICPAQPEKASTATTAYTFDKWVVMGTDTEWDWNTAITEDVSLVAVFTASERLYSVVVNGVEQKVALGGKAVRPEDATKADDETNSYEFEKWILADTGADWDFENDTVNRNLNIIATFKSVPLKYYVVIEGVTTVYGYGDKVARPADPEKDADAQYYYTFDKWVIEGRSKVWDFNQDVIENRWLVDKTLTLVPVFIETLRSYDVTVIYDGEIVLEDEYFYGDKIVCPVQNPVKDMTASTVYTFAGWFNGETEWNFDTSTVSGPTVIVGSFAQEDRKYDYTLTFTTEKMTLAGLEDYTLFDVDYDVVKVTASNGSKTYTAVNGGDNALIRMPAGDYDITVTYKNATYTGSTTMTYADKSESMYLKQIVDLGGKMKGEVNGKRYEYPSFGGNRTIGENSVTTTGITYVYVGEEITDKYYLEADVKLESVGKMIGFMGASTFGNLSNDNDKTLQGDSDRLKHKLTLSFSGGNKLYYSHDNGWGGGGVTPFQVGINTGYADASKDHKMAVLRNGNEYYVFLNGKLISHLTNSAYGKGGFGFCNANGGTSHFTNVRYTVKPDVVDAILEKYDNGTFLGGSFTYPGGATYNSFGSGWSLTSHNSGTINKVSYLFVTDKVGSTYYFEAKFKNTDNWVGLIVNTLDLEPQKNMGWFGFGRYGKGTASGADLATYFHKYHGGWGSGDWLGTNKFYDGDWKIAIARVNRSYYVYYNDVLWKTYHGVTAHTSADKSVALPEDNASGIGIYCGSNLTSAYAEFYDVYATTDATEVQAKIKELA